MLDDPYLMPARPDPSGDPPQPPGDPLSDALELLRVRGGTALRIAAGGAWALRMPAYDYLKFIAQVRGRQWIRVDGAAEPLCLEEGDCLVMHGGRPFTIASDLGAPPVDGRAHFARCLDAAAGSVQWGGEPEVIAIAGRFEFEHAQRALLDAILPAELLVKGASPAAPALRALLELFGQEDAGAPGQSLVTANLARIALVQALRAHGMAAHGGWLGALADPRIGAALRLLHAEPARRWTLAALAQACGMSRSALALRFKTLVGMAPLAYLQHWRMQLARQALRRGSETVGALAYRLGYASESAFSAGFKQHTGMAPGQFRQMARLSSGAPDAAR